MFRISAILILGTLISTGAPTSQAQAALGNQKYGSFGGGPFDTVNLGNLNVHFDIPVRHKAGRGLPFNFDLTYDSTFWQPVVGGSSTAWQPVTTGGWSSSPVAVGSLYWSTSTDGVSYVTYSNFVYFDGAGTPHPFPGSTTYETCCGVVSLVSNAVAVDSSGYTLNANACGVVINGSCTLAWSQYSVDGNSILAQNGQPLIPNAKAGSVIDRNGNEITSDASGNYTDTLGTTALTGAGGCPSPGNCTPYTLTYTSPASTPVSVTTTFRNYTIKTNFGCPGIQDYPAQIGSLVDRVTLPDGTFYQFTYEATPGFSGDVTGRLASIKLPTGGTITYAYTGTHNGIVCSDGTAAGLTRVTPDGSWTYARTQGSGSAWTTTVTDPLNNQTVINFQKDSSTSTPTYSFYETQRNVYQGSSSGGTLVMTTFACYNNNANGCPNPTAVSSPITKTDFYVQPPGLSASVSETTYNGYGMPTDHKDFDFGTVLKREIAYTYPNLGNTIQAFASVITTKDSAGNVVAQTSDYYDETTPDTTSGTPQHVAAPGGANRGNLTRIVSRVNSSYSLTRTNKYFDTGALEMATDVNSATTTYTYGACGNSFVTQTNNQGLTTSATWNCTGGVQTSATDESGNTTHTNYTQDPFWRPDSTTDALGNITSNTYTGQTKAESVLNFNGSASTVDVLTTLDNQGRAFLSQTRQAPGSANFDSVETFYDALGRATGTSLPYVGTAGQTTAAGASPKTTFDPFGRPTQITDNGGASTTYSYTGNLVLVTAGPAPAGENTKRRQLAYDGLKRLTDICEITSASGSGTCAQGVTQTGYWTKYTYDVLDNLTGVTQNAQGSPQQTRSYAYDGLSRMTSETNPESGTKTYIYDTTAANSCNNGYTSNGDLVRTVDANGTNTCFLSDTLHRLTDVGTNRPSTDGCKRFRYDGTNGVLGAKPTGVTISNSMNRLVEIETDNCTWPITGSTILTDEWTSYSKRGEPTDFWESTPNSAGYYHVNESYWANGAQNTLSASLASGNAFVPTQTYGVDGEGRWKTVSASPTPNPILSTSYNAASQITGITFGSNDTDAFTYDTNTDRMTKYTYALNGSSEVGTLTWNSNATLKTLAITDPFNSSNAQTCNYVYDDLARVSSANCGTPWSQTFGYDPFGNITKAGSVSWQPSYNQSSNHYTLAGTSYDSNGNITNDSFRSYTWNVFGRPITIGTKTITYDALDRIAETFDGTTHTQFVYSPAGQLLSKMNGQAATSVRVSLPGAWAVYGASNSFNHYEHLDWLGSSRLSSSQSRAMTSDIAYAPFGEAYASTATSGVSFTGMRSDIQAVSGATTSGLYDFLLRELPPTQGRWLAPDPAGAGVVDPSDPQTWNRYAYLRNSPLNMVDPQGTDGWGDWGGDSGWDWGGFGGGGISGILPGENSVNVQLGTGNLFGDIWGALGLPSGLSCPQVGGVSDFLCGGVNPIMDVNKTWSEDETCTNFLRPAFNDATAGRVQSLFNIWHNSAGPIFSFSRGLGKYDFPYLHQYDGDTFTVHGKKMATAQFANYMAGFQAAARDNEYGAGQFSEDVAEWMAIAFHPKGPYPFGEPWVYLGEKAGIQFGDVGCMIRK